MWRVEIEIKRTQYGYITLDVNEEELVALENGDPSPVYAKAYDDYAELMWDGEDEVSSVDILEYDEDWLNNDPELSKYSGYLKVSPD